MCRDIGPAGIGQSKYVTFFSELSPLNIQIEYT